MEGGRLPQWSEKERLFVIKMINDHFEALFYKYKGASMGNKQKDATWQHVADNFNSSGIAQCRRTVENIKTMYKNTKARAKTKESDKRKTGGGPVVILTSAEEEVIKQLKDKPQMKGINGGIDFTIPSLIPSEDVPAPSLDLTEDFEAPEYEEKEKESVGTSECASSEESKKGTKRKRGGASSVTDELYQLEVQRAQLEVELLRQRIKQDKDLFSLKVEILNETRQQDKTIFSLKEELLSSNIKNALDDGLINFEQ